MQSEFKNIGTILLITTVLALTVFLPTVFGAVTLGEDSITSDGILTLEGATSISAVGDVNVSGSVKQGGNVLMPVGTLMMFSGASAPDGYLIADGSAISRETYSALFAVISTTYGAGDGSTTFNLPNLEDRIAMGANGDLGTTGGNSTVTLTTDQLPEHSHGVTDPGHSHTVGMGKDDGNLSHGAGQYGPGDADGIDYNITSGSSTTGISIDNTGNGEAFSILNPYIKLNYIIKY